MIRDMLMLARAGFLRPTPARFLVAAVGIGVLLIPASRPYGNVRVLALAGIVVALASIAVGFPGLPTAVCGIGIAETAIVAVHEGGFGVPVFEAVVLLVYLIIVDLAGHGRGGETRVDVVRLVTDQAAVVAGGIAALAMVAAISLVSATGSFALALLAIIAAAGVVAALRSMLSR